jgi:membrane protein
MADDTPRPSLPRLAWRAAGTFRAHQMTDNAASLTYYAMLSLFPALLMTVSLLGLFGAADLATRGANYVLEHGADPTTAETVRKVLQTVTDASGAKAGVSFAIATALALNGASGAFAAAGRALNKVYAVDEDRGFVRRKATDVAATLCVLALLIVVLVSLFLGGQVAHDLFATIGLGNTAASIWSIARWPVAFVAALLACALVYSIAPDVVPRRLRWISPGAVTAVVIWLLASAAFGIYIKNFSSYGAAYGAFGAAIVLLLWLYLTANAFLYGAELNMAIERADTAGRGGPPMVTPPPGAPGQRRPPVPTAPRQARSPAPDQASGGPGELTSG